MKNVLQTYIDHLRSADEQLASLVDAGGIDEKYYLNLSHRYVFDLAGRYIYASIIAERLLNIKQQEFIGRTPLELPLDVDDRRELERFASALSSVARKGISITQETANPIPTTWGERYYEYRLTPLWQQGEMAAVLCSIRDITDRKEAEIRYQNEAAKLRRLIEYSPLPIIMVDREGIITTINQSYIQTFLQFQGLNIADLIGKPFQFVGDKVDIKFGRSVVGRVLASGRSITNEYVTICEREWLVNAFPTTDPQTAAVTGAVAIFLEVTDIEKWRREISHIERMNLIGEMATGVAHEIRNPMTVIRGFLQFLMVKADVKLLDYFQLILEELDQINAVVTDFLSMATNKSVEKREQSLNDIIHAVFPLLYSDAAKQGVEIDVRLADNLPKLLLDEREIKQLILNLIRNSIEAMNGKGKLQLKTALKGDTVELVVADNGCGIPNDKLEKIFDPFYTTKETGTGLGLPVCQGIAHRHGGTIQVNSELGKGTEFTVTFNVNPREAAND